MGKKIPMWQIVLVMAFTMIVLCYALNIFGMIFEKFHIKGFGNGYGELHIPLILSASVATIVAVLNGWKWKFIEKGIIASIGRGMQACIILLIVGCLIGSWIAAGIVPAMIYYGLMILNPSIFFVSCCIICAIVALATGSSWTTAGTIGIALIGVAKGLDMSLAITAGAVVSGAYFGDKMSPLSDTTNLAPGIAGSNLFDHIKHMIWTVTPSMVAALIIFAILGINHKSGADLSSVETFKTVLQDNFNLNPVLLIPPLIVIVIVALKIPAIPGLLGGAILGAIFGFFAQGIPLADWFGILHYGFESTTGNAAIDDLLTRGGMDSMLWTINLILCALTFGGVLDATGMLASLAGALLKIAKNTGALVTVTIFSCLFVNIIASDQYLSIILPGRMYKEAFEDRRLKAKNLSRCLEDSGTITSPLVPWNTCGATMSTFLTVPTLTYLPYAFLNYINPLVSIFYGFTGISMQKMSDEEYNHILRQREIDKKAAAEELEAEAKIS